jgi:hypothetical protein
MWLKTGPSAWAFLAASFLLRAPVSFNHPMTLAKLKQPFGSRLEPRGSFSRADAVLSLFSFLILFIAIVLFVAAIL